MKGKLYSRLYYLQVSVVIGETIIDSMKSDLNNTQLPALYPQSLENPKPSLLTNFITSEAIDQQPQG